MGDRRAEVRAATWSDAPAEPVRPGVRRRAFGTDAVMLVMNEIEPEMVAAPHVHETFDQIATIVAGEAIYHVGDEAFEVGPGSLLLIPAGVQHWIEPTGSAPVQNIDVFAPARADFAHLLTWMRPDGQGSSAQ